MSRSWPERFAINVVAPFRDFFVRFGWGAAGILLLIATYRISDIVMGVMANPFYSDTGFTKEEIATVSKVFGVVMTLAGAFVGGIVTMRLGILKTMAVGAVLAAVTNLLFAALAGIGHNVGFLIFTVSADNLAAGLASAAFIAYLSSLTNKAYSATQYALFSSLMLLLPKFIAGFSGVMVESLGYQGFFLLTASMGVPVILLVWWVSRQGARPGADERGARRSSLVPQWRRPPCGRRGPFGAASSWRLLLLFEAAVTAAISATLSAMSSSAWSRFSIGLSRSRSALISARSPATSSGR